jgi:hypothetical protein
VLCSNKCVVLCSNAHSGMASIKVDRSAVLQTEEQDCKLNSKELLRKNSLLNWSLSVLDCVWNVMEHAQKPDFVFRRNIRVHLNRRGRHFSRLLAAEVCASAVIMVVMLDTPCSEVVWRVLVTHSIRQFPLHRVPSHFNWTLLNVTASSKVYVTL